MDSENPDDFKNITEKLLREKKEKINKVREDQKQMTQRRQQDDQKDHRVRHFENV